MISCASAELLHLVSLCGWTPKVTETRFQELSQLPSEVSRRKYLPAVVHMCSPHLVSLMVGRFYVSCCSGSFIQFCYLFQKEIKHTSTNLEPKVISCSSQHFTYYGRRVWLSVPKNSYFFPLGSNTPQFHGTQARPTREAKCPACLLCRI